MPWRNSTVSASRLLGLMPHALSLPRRFAPSGAGRAGGAEWNPQCLWQSGTRVDQVWSYTLSAIYPDPSLL